MSTHCTFYRTGKRMNSTLRPSADGNTWGVDCNFFEPFDILAPEILLRDEGLGTAAPPNNNHIMDYNYVYIERPVDRYYFINKWERIKGIWHGYTSEDVLASWRSTILESQQYIIRSSIKWNDDIPDNFYGYRYDNYKTNTYNFSDTGTSNWSGPSSYFGGRRFIVGINTCRIAQSKDDTMLEPTDETTNYYVVDRYQLWNTILPTIQRGWSGAGEQEEIQLRDYITTIFGLPTEIKDAECFITDKAGSDPITVINYGNYNKGNEEHWTGQNKGKYYGALYFKVADKVRMIDPFKVIWRSFSLDISSIKKDIKYLNDNTYTTMSIQFNPFGKIQIPTNMLINTNSLQLIVDLQPATGDAALYLVPHNASPGATILLATANVAVPILYWNNIGGFENYRRQTIANGFDIAQNIINNIGSSVQGGMSGAEKGGPVGAAVGAIVGGVTTVLPVAESIWKQVDRPPASMMTSIGGATGSALIDNYPVLMVEQYDITDRDDARFGRPLYEKLILGSQLTGATGANNYTISKPGLVVCQGAQIKSGTGTEIGQGILAAERAAIESALNGGVYLE